MITIAVGKTKKMWYSTKEASEYLNITVDTLSQMIINLNLETRPLPRMKGLFISTRDVSSIEESIKIKNMGRKDQ